MAINYAQGKKKTKNESHFEKLPLTHNNFPRDAKTRLNDIRVDDEAMILIVVMVLVFIDRVFVE